MHNVYSGDMKNFRDFTSCCGACSTGMDHGVVCKGCYNFIEGHYSAGEEEDFLQTITKAGLRKEFQALREEYAEEQREEDCGNDGGHHDSGRGLCGECGKPL